jgi:hypothetical protein
MPEKRRVRVSEKTGNPILSGTAVPPSEADSPCACPELDASDWHEVESDWSDIGFVKVHTTALVGVPLGFGGTRKGLVVRAKELNYNVPDDAMLLIGPGKFRRPVMLEVGVPPEATKGIVRPGGHVYTRLVSAPWGSMAKEMEETVRQARDKYAREPDATWVWYLTCSRCSGDRSFETLFVAHYKSRP